MENRLPGSMKRTIAQKKLKFYNIDAIKIAEEVGLGQRINMIMQTAFFKLADVIPVDEAIEYLKAAIKKTYGRKGDKIVEMNWAGVDATLENLEKIDYPASWADAKLEETPQRDEPEILTKVMRPMLEQKGTTLPVSSFAGELEGSY